MSTTKCSNEMLDTTKYSSPLPIIGLYIGAATVVCVMCMVLDMFNGFHRKKFWLPCKLFSLNSFTLTIIGVATKLPFDLDSSMPRSIDQLSKLSGTVLLCISMGFFMPSIGAMLFAECVTNLVALTIIVVSVIVNVCIQLSTRVIFTFFIEHVVVIICMLLLLVHSSFTFFKHQGKKEIRYSFYRQEAMEELSSVKDTGGHLKKLYALSYSSNSQLLICETSIYSFNSQFFCVIGSAMLLVASIRSFLHIEMGYCNKASDYKWSMWWIVVTQVVAIVLGCFIICYRWLILVRHLSIRDFRLCAFVESIVDAYDSLRRIVADNLPDFEFGDNICVGIFANSFLAISGIVTLVIHVGPFLLNQLVVFLCMILKKWFAFGVFTGEWRGDVSFSVYCSIANDGLNEWISVNVVENMKRLKEASKRDAPTHLIQLLSKTFPPSQHSVSLLSSITNGLQRRGMRISCLSIVLLARILEVTMWSPLDFLLNSLDEAVELIYFLDKSGLAKDIWDRRNMPNHWFQKEIMAPVLAQIPQPTESSEEAAKLHHALEIIRGMDNFELAYHVDLKIICECILERTYASFAEFSECIEKTFVEMVRELLTHFPETILKDILGTTIEESEEKVMRSIEIFYKHGLDVLQDYIQFSLPNRQTRAIGIRDRPWLCLVAK